MLYMGLPRPPAPDPPSTCMAPAGSCALWLLGGLNQWEPLAGDQRKGVRCVCAILPMSLLQTGCLSTTDHYSSQNPLLYKISLLKPSPYPIEMALASWILALGHCTLSCVPYAPTRVNGHMVNNPASYHLDSAILSCWALPSLSPSVSSFSHVKVSL